MEKQTLFIDGEVITVNGSNQVTEAVAIKGNRIQAVGSTEDILTLKDENSEVIKLNGNTLMPGFIDSHLHITMYGTNALSISCKSEHIQSIDNLLKDIKKRATSTPKGEWIRAWGYHEGNIAEKRFPTKEEMDTVTTDHPILVVRTCGHISAVNSHALRLANIDKNTPDPDGGRFEKRKDGELTGLMVENAHMKMFTVASFTDEEMRKAHKIASEHFAEKGITSIHDATGYGLDNIHALQADSQKGVIKQRIYAMIGALSKPQDVVKHMVDSGIFTGLGDNKFKIGPVKLFLDGSSSGPTIWTRDPYTSDPENFGVHYFKQEEVDELFIPAHAKGWQITSHAQGDAAIDMLLKCIEKANELYPRQDTRHRIEHAGIATPDLIKRMKEQNVVPIPNPAFHYEYGDGYIENYGERAAHMYPLGDYLKEDVVAAIASDCPVTDFSPIRGIHTSLTRQSHSGQIVGENQKVSLLEAIRMYTINGAYASFEEDVKGSLEPGKLADLILFDRSLMNTDTDELLEAQVEWTMIDGEIVYNKTKVEVKS
ncbi:amidohydrolase [Virgibacillus necropolis]|uniref:Amidohydrolase n=1 Tax=Virgibacillus necropolis TaxID=163877 RepID=A0A221M9V6_9BACI|nr:amidohydrolase [Virgibacillus necropolis]ASN04448.1 amidohydrolase [Virgibacillus necropolis]